MNNNKTKAFSLSKPPCAYVYSSHQPFNFPSINNNLSRSKPPSAYVNSSQACFVTCTESTDAEFNYYKFDANCGGQLTTAAYILDDSIKLPCHLDVKELLKQQLLFKKHMYHACSIDNLDKFEVVQYPEITYYSMDDPSFVALARFAVEEFNKQKNAQLEFVRVVRACENYNTHPFGMSYYLTLEAVDDGVLKVYQAMVVQGHAKMIPVLKLFGLVLDNGSLLKLIGNREKVINTGDSPGKEKIVQTSHRWIYTGVSAQGLEYHMSLVPSLAGFAMEEFNKRKNAQLQFVKVLRASWKPRYQIAWDGHNHPGQRLHICSGFYDLVVEAVDGGVVKAYIAKVSVSFTDGMWLEEFHLPIDKDCGLKLYHHLDNFYDE